MTEISEFISKCVEAGAKRFATDATKYAGDKYYDKCIYVFDKNNKLMGSFSNQKGVIYRVVKEIEMKGRTFIDYQCDER